MKDKNFSSHKTTMFDKEYSDTLNRLYNDNLHFNHFKWFLDTAYDWAYSQKRPDVVLLGTEIPEELVIASGATPYWLIGGSAGSTVWSDELVPRDTDPVSRSILGYIHRLNGADFSDTLFIIPLINDAMRKIAYELKSEGRKICLVDISPDRNDSYAPQKYTKQLKAMCGAVSEHMGVRVTRQSVISAMKCVSAARHTLHRFLAVSQQHSGKITDTAVLFVRNTYYLTNSLVEWTHHTEQLISEIEHGTDRRCLVKESRPNVLLMGSPIIFPNYKIPFLLQDIGLSVGNTVDGSTLRANVVYHSKAMMWKGRDRLIETVAEKWYAYDCSSAFIRNDVLYDYVSWLVRKGTVDGVVCHILKGQLAYDFELDRFETMLSQYGIPVFRLETDYQYQDVEQLRIRMEAFSEMLAQKKYKEVRKAS